PVGLDALVVRGASEPGLLHELIAEAHVQPDVGDLVVAAVGLEQRLRALEILDGALQALIPAGLAVQEALFPVEALEARHGRGAEEEAVNAVRFRDTERV